MPRYETVRIKVDDATIANGDSWAVIQPVWWLASIYDGPGECERTLKPVTRSQRLVFAIRWCIAEVNNGGHRQFFSDSTGIVWPDARDGFTAFGVPDGAEIVAAAATG